MKVTFAAVVYSRVSVETAIAEFAPFCRCAVGNLTDDATTVEFGDECSLMVAREFSNRVLHHALTERS